jgi:outer membrane protein TolC
VRASQGALAEAVGATPTITLRTLALDARSLPDRLAEPVQRILEIALRQRPDLQSLAAEVTAREAGVRRARRAFAPRLTLGGAVGYQLWRFKEGPADAFTLSEPVWDAQLGLDWPIFTGFARLNDLHVAEAERAASRAALTAGALRALREAWTAYFDVQTAQRKLEFATALQTSSEEAYDATLEAYRHGLGTLIDLLAAERAVADARGTLIGSRAELLTAAAALALAVGGVPDGAR